MKKYLKQFTQDIRQEVINVSLGKGDPTPIIDRIKKHDDSLVSSFDFNTSYFREDLMENELWVSMLYQIYSPAGRKKINIVTIDGSVISGDTNFDLVVNILKVLSDDELKSLDVEMGKDGAFITNEEYNQLSHSNRAIQSYRKIKDNVWFDVSFDGNNPTASFTGWMGKVVKSTPNKEIKYTTEYEYKYK